METNKSTMDLKPDTLANSKNNTNNNMNNNSNHNNNNSNNNNTAGIKRKADDINSNTSNNNSANNANKTDNKSSNSNASDKKPKLDSNGTSSNNSNNNNKQPIAIPKKPQQPTTTPNTNATVSVKVQQTTPKKPDVKPNSTNATNNNTNNTNNNAAKTTSPNKPPTSNPIKNNNADNKPKPSSNNKMKDDSDSDSDSDSEDDNVPLFQKFNIPNPNTAAKSAAKPAANNNSNNKPSSASSKPSTSSASKPGTTKPTAPPKPATNKNNNNKPESKNNNANNNDSDDDSDDDDEEEEEDYEEEEEEEDEKPKRKSSSDKPSKKDKKAAASMKNQKVHDPKLYARKQEALPLVETKGANKWWNRAPPKHKQKWETLDHNGPILAPEYEKHNVKMLYDGRAIELNSECEEVATMYAAMLETDYAKNPVFNKNFFRDWRNLSGFPKDIIKDFNKCNFRPIYEHVQRTSEQKKLARKDPEVKRKEKEEKERLNEIYGYALVDGYKEKIQNYRVEPPGLFRGRGAHPKTGTLKHRVLPEDITINIAQNLPIPKVPMTGHDWHGIIHDPTVTWLAYWKDNVNGAYKYMWLAPSSKFKGESDIKKYTKAQRLKDCIEDIRKNYNTGLVSKYHQIRQRSTAIYLIDKLALRVGNEKDTSEVADTVGCCSLRVEHLTLKNTETEPFTITLDFLGKDSMRYFATHQIDERVWKNLKEFTDGKKPKDDIFDALTTGYLNEHLKSLMDGLTAKVFRTYNASITLQNQLYNEPSNEVDPEDSVNQKMVIYNRANREVAILCNHQKTISKGHDVQMQKLNDTLEALRDEQEELEDLLEQREGGKKSNTAEAKEQRKLRDKARKVRFEARWGRRKQELEEKGRKDKKSDEEIAEIIANEESKLRDKKTPNDIEKALDTLRTRIENYEAKAQLKDESKQVALGTSKINYMDPRITVAWCKVKEVPIEKIFSKTLLQKFPWAMEAKSTWRF